MDNSQKEISSPMSEQLAAIQQQLSQLAGRFDSVDKQLHELSSLPQKIAQIEEKFILVADSYRYQDLQQYLADGNWFEADKETIRLILEIMGQEIEELSPEDIQHFPCNDLMVIDQLWQKYSDRRFGFSIQLAIYQDVGGTLDSTIEQNQQLVEKWGDRVGWREGNRWRKCSELDYSLDAPEGCHPSRWWNSPYGSKMTNFFLARLMNCNI